MPFMKVRMQRETTGGMVDTLTGRQDEWTEESRAKKDRGEQ